MPRKPRSKSPTGYFHITLRGNGGQLLFDDAEDRIAMLQILDAILPKHNIELVAWCLMGNHIHLLIDDPDDRNEAILALRKQGLTVKQVQLLTGLETWIIKNAS